MFYRLEDGRVINTDYLLTLGVGKIKEDEGFNHVLGTLINGQIISLGKHLSSEVASDHLSRLQEEHNLSHVSLADKK